MHRRAPRPCLHPRLPTPAACQIPFVPILRHPPVFASAGLAAFFPPSSRGLAPLRGLKPLNPKTSESGRAPPGPRGRSAHPRRLPPPPSPDGRRMAQPAPAHTQQHPGSISPCAQPSGMPPRGPCGSVHRRPRSATRCAGAGQGPEASDNVGMIGSAACFH